MLVDASDCMFEKSGNSDDLPFELCLKVCKSL